MPSSPQSLGFVFSRLVELEKKYDLFAKRIQGVPFWPLIRFPLFLECLYAEGVFAKAAAPNQKGISKLDCAAFALKTFTTHARRLPLLAPSADIFILGHQRREKGPDGRFYDAWFDALVPHLPHSSVMFEMHHEYRHRTPPGSDNLFYLDAYNLLSGITKKLRKFEFSDSETAFVRHLQERIASFIGAKVDLQGLVTSCLRHHLAWLPLYTRLLRKVAPKYLFLTVGYCNQTAMCAAKMLGIPVVELQHGVISQYHPGYAQLQECPPEFTPDRVFTFGPFWDQFVELPATAPKAVPIGMPRLEEILAEHRHTEKQDTLLFLSQWSNGNHSSRLAVEYAARAPKHLEIIYKLHPQEESDWQSLYPWLAENKRIQVEGGGVPNLYTLLARSKWMVGGYSTAIFEGLAFGCKPIILDQPGIEHVERFLNDFDVPVVKAAEEIDLESLPPLPDKEAFFVTDWQSRLSDALGGLENIQPSQPRS